MKNKSVVVGFCPISKFVFSHDDAMKQKLMVAEKLKKLHINFVDIDGVVNHGLVRGNGDVEPVVRFFKQKNIDCIFMPHCNFGTESAVGLIAKHLDVPVLMWGPRDGAPLSDGTRLRDSLCGIFASTKVLNSYGIPFSYIPNCSIDDIEFHDGLLSFFKAVNIVKRFYNARIGIAGNRIDFFWCTIINEQRLLRQFNIQVLPFDLISIVKAVRLSAGRNTSAYESEIRSLAANIDISEMDKDGLTNILALRDVLLEMADKHGLSAWAMESFMSITEELGGMISFAQSQVTDRGVPCVTESDIHGAISSIIAEAAELHETPSFFADLTIRHPENNNGLLLWHDAFPYSLKHPDSSASIGKHWILPGIKPGSCHWKLKDGDITIVRFDSDGDTFKVTAKEVRTVSGPSTRNTYVWVEMDDWPEFEQKIVYGPYLHHVACIYGKCSRSIKEACKFIKGVEYDG